ncbi:MAG: 30S ribosomal protein S6 [Clostridia bacterium]|nr:30S ribosomal protein S6 [Clostridia bacterium]
MTKIVNKYETIFVVDAALEQEQIDAVVEKFKSLIEANAQIDNIDVWGKKRLAYEINYKTEGYYVLVEFTSEPSFPAELERVYGITEGILRSLIIVKEHYE